jgi:hypothetical protein
LLSDEGNTLRKKFGVPSYFFGALAGRQTYVTDRQGVVQLIYNNQFQPKKHIQETLKFLQGFWLMTNATVFDAKTWEWNKDSLMIMEMQAAELQALCTRYNLKPAKIGKATVATAIINHLMVPRADVVMKQDVHNAMKVTMEQVAENILALAMEAKIVIITGQVEMLQNKVDAMAKSFDTMQDNGEKWKEVMGRKVDKVANKVDRATDADLVKAKEVNIRVIGLTMSKGETSKHLMELVQTELLDRLITLASVHDKLTVLCACKGLQGT